MLDTTKFQSLVGDNQSTQQRRRTDFDVADMLAEAATREWHRERAEVIRLKAEAAKAAECGIVPPGVIGPRSTVKQSNPKDVMGVRKAGLSAVPMNVVAEIGVAMTEGAAKYGRHNFRAVGVRASVYFDAQVGRHLLDWWEGEDIDPESGVHHIVKAIAGLMVLRDSMLRGNWEDDRPPRSKPYRDDLNRKAAEILDRHAGKTPRHYTIADSE